MNFKPVVIQVKAPKFWHVLSGYIREHVCQHQ